MTKHKQQRLDKATDKIVQKPNKDSVPLGIKVISLLFLGIMLLSLISFALLYSPNQSGGNVNEEGIPENLPLQEIQQEGQTYWVAVKNYEVFVFQQPPSTYEALEDMRNVATRLNNMSEVQIYQTNQFNDSNALYLIEKYLGASNIAYSRAQNQSCTQSTLYLKSDTDTSPEGECMVVSAEEGEEIIKVEAILYNLLQ